MIKSKYFCCANFIFYFSKYTFFLDFVFVVLDVLYYSLVLLVEIFSLSNIMTTDRKVNKVLRICMYNFLNVIIMPNFQHNFQTNKFLH